MNKISLLIFFLYLFYSSNGQSIAVAAEKLNILYIAIDNPLSIAAENTPSKSLVVKATRGDVIKIDNKFIYRVTEGMGPVDIIVFEKVGTKLKELGRSAFRVQRTELPELVTPGIGSSATVDELLSMDSIFAKFHHLQLYTPVEEFTIETVSCDTGRTIERTFYGNKIGEEVKKIFQSLRHGDILLIERILVTLHNEKGVEVQGRRILIK